MQTHTCMFRLSGSLAKKSFCTMIRLRLSPLLKSVYLSISTNSLKFFVESLKNDSCRWTVVHVWPHEMSWDTSVKRVSRSCMTPWNVLRHQCHVGPPGTEVNKNRRKAIFHWAAKGLCFLKGGGGYTHSGYHKTLSATIACDRISCETET